MPVKDGGRLNDRIVFVGTLAVVSFAFMQQALKLQRSETDRRLHDLNNEAARLQSAVAANVSSDTWKAFVDTYKDDGNRNNARFKTIESFQNKLLGAIAITVIAVPAITAIVVYLLTRHAVPATTNGGTP